MGDIFVSGCVARNNYIGVAVAQSSPSNPLADHVIIRDSVVSDCTQFGLSLQGANIHLDGMSVARSASHGISAFITAGSIVRCRVDAAGNPLVGFGGVYLAGSNIMVSDIAVTNTYYGVVFAAIAEYCDAYRITSFRPWGVQGSPLACRYEGTLVP